MVRSLRLSLTTAALLTLTLEMLASSAVPASAHKSFVEHGRDFAYTSKNHRIGYVCDKERDGHIVEAWFYLSNGEYISMIDLDGSAGDCTGVDLPAPAHSFALCEEAKGCTRYYYA